uniref:Uncharacterized protein n=1 Tax=Triticum urartu TaxID=4572 RepID=A0A8R7P853_TRIUA
MLHNWQLKLYRNNEHVQLTQGFQMALSDLNGSKTTDVKKH